MAHENSKISRDEALAGMKAAFDSAPSGGMHGPVSMVKPTEVPKDFVIPTVDDERRSWDLFSRMFKDRVLRLDGPVDDRMAAIATSAIHFLELEDPEKPINIIINSPGGSVTAGLGIIDTMKNCACPVKTFCYGFAASMGSLLLCAGDERYASPNSWVMIHQPLGGGGGQQTEVSINASILERMREQLTDIYARKTGLPHETLDELIERDNWLTPQQAVKLGLIDAVITQEAYFASKYADKNGGQVPDHKKDPYPDNARKKPRETITESFNKMVDRAAKKRPSNDNGGAVKPVIESPEGP